MSSPRLSLRVSARPAALVIAALAAVGATGCDLQTNADVERGRLLFLSQEAQCAQCHTLADAGTNSDIGPNLDAAFAQARSEGMDNDTIEGVVQAQIGNPREIRLPPSDPAYSRVFMPADLVEGQDAEDVAAYVASVAGVPGIEVPEVPDDPGATVFQDQGCGSCHTMEAVGSEGQVGPNLDDVLPGQKAADVERSITDPEAEKSPGFESGAMPPFTDLAEQELADLVDFLLKYAGKSGKSK